MPFENLRILAFLHHTRTFSYLQKDLFFVLKKAKLLAVQNTFLFGNCLARIFGNARQSGKCQLDAAGVFTLLLLSQNTYRIRISFKINKICPFFLIKFWFEIVFISVKITGDGIFSGMSEGRISHIVTKAGCSNDITEVMQIKTFRIFTQFVFKIFVDELTDDASQTSAYGRNLQRMR